MCGPTAELEQAMDTPAYHEVTSSLGTTIPLTVWVNAPAQQIRSCYSRWIGRLPADTVPPSGVIGDGCLRILWDGVRSNLPYITDKQVLPSDELIAGLASALGGKAEVITPLNRVFIPLKGATEHRWSEASAQVAKAVGFQRGDYYPCEFCLASWERSRWAPVGSQGMMIYLPDRTDVEQLLALLEYVPVQVTGDIYATLSVLGTQMRTHRFCR